MASVKFTDNSGKAKQGMYDGVNRALEAIGLQAEGYAQLELERNPRRIDTGNLRGSISHRVVEDSAYIGTNVEYGIYVHEGTVRMEPNRFLKNAVERHVDEYKAMVEHFLKG